VRERVNIKNPQKLYRGGGGGVNYVVKGIEKIHQYPNVKICEM
jgi:hypothetical protein